MSRTGSSDIARHPIRRTTALQARERQRDKHLLKNTPKSFLVVTNPRLLSIPPLRYHLPPLHSLSTNKLSKDCVTMHLKVYVPLSWIRADTLGDKYRQLGYAILNDPVGEADPQLDDKHLIHVVMCNLTVGALAGQGTAKDGCPSRLDYTRSSEGRAFAIELAKWAEKHGVSNRARPTKEQGLNLVAKFIDLSFGPDVARELLKRLWTRLTVGRSSEANGLGLKAFLDAVVGDLCQNGDFTRARALPRGYDASDAAPLVAAAATPAAATPSAAPPAATPPATAAPLAAANAPPAATPPATAGATFAQVQHAVQHEETARNTALQHERNARNTALQHEKDARKAAVKLEEEQRKAALEQLWTKIQERSDREGKGFHAALGREANIRATEAAACRQQLAQDSAMHSRNLLKEVRERQKHQQELNGKIWKVAESTQHNIDEITNQLAPTIQAVRKLYGEFSKQKVREEFF
ncbi:hypothetical protein CERZMDRAFT_87856 [Cercospora zeae-maydis SCOH1-5]|uniref:Uncharacterized protein n=1 Tax=Cercospora zeae-maydis SCOH1-5 TaxID=717836 RepID=A0A6A6F2X7_9PEZI|nr:hypothetical protein CERZMDRAFT_87856 [Cercospora zeae-maydis SCOH1-5]